MPTGVTVKRVSDDISISYKETHICETEAKAWAGYVHLSSKYLADVQDPGDPYQLSTFFWYVEARHAPREAPTAMYLAGGPGQSSMWGMAEAGGGSCSILPDSNSTTENNPFSWNVNVNILYVDQPNLVGFSYGSLVNSTMDLLFLSDTGIIPFDAYNGSVPAENTTFVYGTFPSQNFAHTANNSAMAAKGLWHISQAWFSEFPEWNTCNKKISVWGNSYGGYSVPATAEYIQKQNVRIQKGELNDSLVLELDTIGITNGCIDFLYQAGLYPDIAYNNTYDLQVINKTVYEEAKHDWAKPGGCRDLILNCRELVGQYDPDQLSINATVNNACLGAELYCSQNVVSSPYDDSSNRSDFDMAQYKPDPTPPSYLIGFFNQDWVQQALGAPVNFTSSSNAVALNYLGVTGDAFRTAGMKSIEYLLNSGIKVALSSGDLDYRCPWNTGEALSLQANWTGDEGFRKAGYEMIHTNDTYNGGVVRQHGLLSFARVFNAGHDLAAFQPETSFQIFNRVMLNKDVATGEVPTNGRFGDYSTKGPASSFHIKNKLPAALPAACYLYSVASTCTVDQYLALLNGTAEIVDFSVVTPAGGGGGIVLPGL
ncbi:hypothetical protein LTR08_003632 [Meristemomyces frigidus]|nr:hypothetical protein LTR08_003632 [Meristemomyces frigidus]